MRLDGDEDKHTEFGKTLEKADILCNLIKIKITRE